MSVHTIAKKLFLESKNMYQSMKYNFRKTEYKYAFYKPEFQYKKSIIYTHKKFFLWN